MNAAVIVLYNPDIELLTQNVSAIAGQVDTVIFSDNGHREETDKVLKALIDKYGITYIDNGGNKGIAFALNRAVEYCKRGGIKWLLTLDQDSVCPENMISEYERHIADDIAILSCAIDYNGKELEIEKKDELTELDECITSASYMNVDICAGLGGFDEQMFIDRVDFEYCYRVKKAGYRVVRVNSIVLDHRLGELELKKISGKTVHVGGHSPFRKFYIAQNIVYCTKKHPDICPKGYCVKKLTKLFFKTVVYENNRFKKAGSIIKGVRSGRKMKPQRDNWISE